MNLRRVLWGSIVVGMCAGPATASPETDPRERRAIRGCPVDDDCARAGEGLREFELETFPRHRGGSPWAETSERGGSASATTHAPDAPPKPWLENLVLPDIPVRWDERVIKYLEFYRDDPRGQNIIRAWLRDQGRYRDLIHERLEAAGLPKDLLYISMIESSYDPGESSYAGAAGLWQFMPDGGQIYGMRVDHWVDERRDPVKSTDAVVLYFQDLYERFGDWHLSLCAFNAGWGAVLKSIAKYNTNDFWDLLDYENGLPWESSLYVPKWIATAIVGNNREAFGFGDVTDAAPYAYDVVRVPQSITLEVIAHAAGTDVATVRALNPHVTRNRTPPGTPQWEVRVPIGAGAAFPAKLEAMRETWDGFEDYEVSHGERFEDIATMHGISYARLKALNDIEHERQIHGGLVLVVPRVSEEEKKENLARANDDLYAAGVPAGEPGEDALIVAVPDASFAVEGKRRVFYRVVSGDTLWGISRALGVDRFDLAGWNGLEAEAHLHPRMVLQAFVPRDARKKLVRAGVKLLDERRVLIVTRGSEAHLDLAEERVGRRRVTYEAKKKESFADIGDKFGLTARDLARINRRPHTTVLEPGETIIVYEVVDRTKSDRAAEQAEAAED